MNCPHHTSTIPLEPKSSQKPYKCHGCNMGGVGPHYGCPKCTYEVHNECIFPSYKLTSTFLGGQVFEFKEHPPPLTRCKKSNCRECGCWCDACGMAITGCYYHCHKAGLAIHPCCVMLKEEIEIQGVNFRLEMEKKPTKCDCCDSKRVEGSIKDFPGWCYVSTYRGYSYHVFCIMNMAIKSWEKITRGTRYVQIEDDYCYYGLALEKLEMLPVVKKKKNDGKSGNKYWKMLKMLATCVLSVVFGDPTMAAAKFTVEVLVQLLS